MRIEMMVLEAKTNFSRLLKQAESGHDVIICRGDGQGGKTPVVRLIPYTEKEG
jgi:antitoxin (DNA-binding transcriptional repressor) of toxin-antitoxin stability system